MRTVFRPAVIRITHWINAFAMLCMVSSGMGIYNAHPIFDFSFPPAVTLGGWLGGSTIWHFAVMWLLVGNGLLYLLFGVASGYLGRQMFPVRLGELLRDVRLALAFRLRHESGSYNTIQKALYIAVLLLGVLMVTTGLAIWKPVQFSPLTALFGGFDFARVVHFLGMAAILCFTALHLVMVILVPQTLLSMVTGTSSSNHKRRADRDEKA
ncbi:cytochrome b/b6 domain-containing protein [Rhizobium sp. BC56]|nr:cytochrome b/b6 domain-containing protein [Rhizobium sp. BC56]MDC7746564.1 cytochrome b/b6 domain-containing protein [Rhizobium sp. BC56]